MEDSQRAAHYDAWAKGKKWATIDVWENPDKTWSAKCETQDMHLVRNTKQQSISAIHGQLAAKGIEISNLAEIQGI